MLQMDMPHTEIWEHADNPASLGPEAVAELEAGRASIARLRSALMDTLDDLESMVKGVKQYDLTLCTMLARMDRAKAALTHDVAAAASVIERVDRRSPTMRA